MPRINPNPNPDAKSQELLAGVKQMLGSTPNIFTTLAHSSSALGFTVNGIVGFKDSKIPAPLREQIALTVAGADGCDYCASAHTFLGKMNKIPEPELGQNLEGKSTNAKTQAALTFARKLVALRGRVSDADVAAVRSAGYSDGEIIDIIAITSFNIFTNYFNEAVGTAIDFPVVSTAKISKVA